MSLNKNSSRILEIIAANERYNLEASSGECIKAGNHKNIEQDDGKQWPQVFAVVAVSLGAFTCGINFAWSSPFTFIITHEKEIYDITQEEASLFMLFQPLGTLFGASFYCLFEILGRKKSMIFLAVPHVSSWVVTIFAKSKWEFYFARFIAGVGDAVIISSVPAYVGEITTPTVRGFSGNSPTFFLYGGQMFITVLGSYLNIQTTSMICIGIPILYVFLVTFLPESPYQLIKDGKMEEAKRSIQWLTRKADVEEHFLQLKADVERQISESGSWSNVFKIPSNWKAVRAGMFLRLSQQFAGITPFVSYGQTIFDMAGGNLSPQCASMLFIGLVWMLNACGFVTVEKFGRTTSYFYSLLLSGFVLTCLGVYLFIDQYHLTNLENLKWFPLAGMVTYVFTYSFGLGVVPVLMMGELFSASIKAKGLAALITSYAIGILAATNLFHLLIRCVGFYSPFLLYAICCFLSSYVTLKWIPETKGKSLEEIQQCLKNL